MRGRSLKGKRKSVSPAVKPPRLGGWRNGDLEPPIPASALPGHLPCMDPDCSPQGQPHPSSCRDTSSPKGSTRSLGTRSSRLAPLQQFWSEESQSAPHRAAAVLAGSQAQEQISLVPPAKQPGLQRHSPREGREFVLNAGLVSFLLGLSSPATWQPCTERSPCPGCWQTGTARPWD